MRRLLVTGKSGFVGSTVARLVMTDPRLADWTIVDIDRALDLRDARAVTSLVENAAPDAVLHLAAQSSVPDAFRAPQATLEINLIGTLHLLEALRQAHFAGRMVYVSSGDVYGLVPSDDLPVSEARPPAPRNPYAVSKVAGEALCYQWTITEGMDVVIARPFNHVGPGQSERFVLSDFARQLAAIRAGLQEPLIQAGDIDVTRDFTDVRDVGHAYFALLEHGAPGEVYNVCSGRERSVRELLRRLIELAGQSGVRVEQQEARLRKAEQRRIAGNPAKIKRDAGWEATTDLDESLAGLLTDWEHRIHDG